MNILVFNLRHFEIQNILSDDIFRNCEIPTNIHISHDISHDNLCNNFLNFKLIKCQNFEQNKLLEYIYIHNINIILCGNLLITETKIISDIETKCIMISFAKEPHDVCINKINEFMKNPLLFSIIYKTYKNDLQWLEYSLLSLKKFLNPINVFELIIYTHDVVFFDVQTLLKKIQMKQFINYRVIPVHYNYHGYIKQQQVKADCYKDVKTKYVIFLDSDLLLKRPLNFNSLIREDKKIEWKYLKKEDDPGNQVFSVWKKACEDATRTPKTLHYMSNGFPFIFTTKSLEEAANHFINLHNCDYEAYCHKRCRHENIQINDSTVPAFDRLSRVFTEFEYLGYFCHHFSNDYVFTTTPYCRMYAQFQKDNDDSYFIQNWSHGGFNVQILKKIKQILQL